MYGKKYMGILRSAFLIDEKGKVAEAWYEHQPEGHAGEPPRGAREVSDALPKPIDVLPHRPPFLFVDEVTALVPGQSAARRVAAHGGGVVLPRPLPGKADAAGRAHGRVDRAARRGRRAHRRAVRGKLPLFGGLDTGLRVIHYRRQAVRGLGRRATQRQPHRRRDHREGQGHDRYQPGHRRAELRLLVPGQVHQLAVPDARPRPGGELGQVSTTTAPGPSTGTRPNTSPD